MPLPGLQAIDGAERSDQIQRRTEGRGGRFRRRLGGADTRLCTANGRMRSQRLIDRRLEALRHQAAELVVAREVHRLVADIAFEAGAARLQAGDRSLVSGCALRQASLGLRHVDLGAFADLQPLIGGIHLRLEEFDVFLPELDQLRIADDTHIGLHHGEQHVLLGVLQRIAREFGQRPRRIDIGIRAATVIERLRVAQAERKAGIADVRRPVSDLDTLAGRGGTVDGGELGRFGEHDVFRRRVDRQQGRHDAGIVLIGAGQSRAERFRLCRRRNQEKRACQRGCTQPTSKHHNGLRPAP